MWGVFPLVSRLPRLSRALASGPGMYYRRPLPSSCIDFSSPAGKSLFAEALAAGNMECYFQLASQFRTQDEPAFCGLSTLVMVLNALSIDPGRAVRAFTRANEVFAEFRGLLCSLCSGRGPGDGFMKKWYVKHCFRVSLVFHACALVTAGLLRAAGHCERIGEPTDRPHTLTLRAVNSSVTRACVQGITLRQFSCLARCNAASVQLTYGDEITLDGTCTVITVRAIGTYVYVISGRCCRLAASTREQHIFYSNQHV